ncbi:hypothetical protein OSH08_00720 [Kaistia geumhonensis]|uniref:Uncharacterized protein n=1 Tax=Kaistia geumhonensis TaxID=410839 RepID=A0ABU0M948_9HYPH|nr:hypothetical protein [Kaistia geumhonensis]MCX5477505.1 hypothetical protein [Kaistia geumhonensis]MDQ0517288.1 hypothetical protein [Kaistia geumhonensis]
MFDLIRLAFLYCLFGAGILFVQINNTPCRAPVVLDDGASPPLGPPIDLIRLGADRDYAMRLGKAVVFWLPRLVDLVGIRGMPFPDYLFGSVCRSTEAQPPPAAPMLPVVPQLPAVPQSPAATQARAPVQPPVPPGRLAQPQPYAAPMPQPPLPPEPLPPPTPLPRPRGG